jgi:hypothetical protein
MKFQETLNAKMNQQKQEASRAVTLGSHPQYLVNFLSITVEDRLGAVKRIGNPGGIVLSPCRTKDFTSAAYAIITTSSSSHRIAQASDL